VYVFFFITNWHSVAKRGGCFQQRLFVCPHDTFSTIKHRMMKLGGQMHRTNILPEFKCHGQSSKVKVTRDKKEKPQSHPRWKCIVRRAL